MANRLSQFSSTSDHYPEVLTAIATLTPPPCHEASTREIWSHLRKGGCDMTIFRVGHLLMSLRQNGFVAKIKMRSESIWSLTDLGKSALRELNKKGVSK
ncbi:MAG: hypothetical protein M1469_01160 [Bacteroidetes bacterium]|nr:hypothetical protein [Bacteroidota bacterium]